MKTTETKLADSIANAVEDHWFNPAILAHLLSNQPHYTIDRIMEVVAHLLKFNSKRYKADYEQGVSSEGLILSNELNDRLQQIKDSYEFTNLRLPTETKKFIAKLPEPAPGEYKYSWLHEPERNPFDDVHRVL